MANYENSVDLKKEVLQHAGELDDGTSEYDETVMTFLNRAYQAILSGASDLGMDVGQPWAWAKKPYPSTIIIQPAIRTYTVSAMFNSAGIVLSSAPSESIQNYFISFGDDSQVYRIKSHVAGSPNASLDSVFLGDTSVSYATRLMKYDYELDTNILRLIGPFSGPNNYGYNYNDKIEMIDMNSFNRDYPMGIREGIPDRVTQIFKSNEMQPVVRFNRIPSATEKPIRIEYDYIPLPDELTNDEASIPVVPRDHRVTLCYYAAYYLMMDKNDNRAAEYRELARQGMLAMVRAAKVEKANTNANYGRVIPRSDSRYGNFGRWFRGYF